MLSYRDYSSRHKILFLILILFFCFLLYQCSSSSRHHRNDQNISVILAETKASDVPIIISALGSVTPTYNVTVRTQINGQLLRVLFREGQIVKKDDLLAEVDARPYQAQLTQFEGQLARDTALLANAQLDLKRYKTLWKQDSVAKQTYDTQTSLVKQLQGTVKIDQGLIENTKLNLYYCNITSPIDGRVGLRLVDAGNYIQVSDVNGIAVINTLNPITVVFSIPEDDVPKVMAQINAGKILNVEAYDREQTKLLSQGKLITVDNQIDVATGTVKLKAHFDNANNQLFPNQFVNVKLLVNTIQNAIVVPIAAIQHGVEGDFVFLVNKDNTVSVKPVKIGASVSELAMISSGLALGQSVVIEGADKLTEGATVVVANKATNTSVDDHKAGPYRRIAS